MPDDHDHPHLRIGPGDDPTDLMARARSEAQREADDRKLGVQLARRLIVAFVACLLIGVACFAVIPATMGVTIPPWVPLLSFLAIMTGALLTVPLGEGDADHDEIE